MNIDEFYVRLAHLDEQIELLEEQALSLRSSLVRFNAEVAGVTQPKISEKLSAQFERPDYLHGYTHEAPREKDEEN